MHFREENPHKDVVLRLAFESGRDCPNLLGALAIGPRQLLLDGLVLRVGFRAKHQVCDGVLMAREHFGVWGHLLEGDLHRMDHTLSISFKKAATPTHKDSITGKHEFIDSPSHLVPINPLNNQVLRLVLRPTLVQNMPLCVARRVVALHFCLIRQQIEHSPLLDRVISSGDVVYFATNDHDFFVFDEVLDAFVAIRMIPMLMRAQHGINPLEKFHTSLLRAELLHLLHCTAIDQEIVSLRPRLKIGLQFSGLCDEVAEVVFVLGDDPDVYHFNNICK